MPSIDELLELAKRTTAEAGARLAGFAEERVRYRHDPANVREVKAVADAVLEQAILQALIPTGVPVLSEESGMSGTPDPAGLLFIVDPLDGTFNFVKGLGPSAVCVALWEGEQPLFGVIYSLAEQALYWGGAKYGAHAGGARIAVSATAQLQHASLCTGFPARFDFNSEVSTARFMTTAARYAKVRMLGSAAVSLLQVARGSADAYAEENIMLWDVAAGLAIVAAAGGSFTLRKTARQWCHNVTACNGVPALEPCP
jgi:myo-inositol-1(or 4)-monophosphatase